MSDDSRQCLAHEFLFEELGLSRDLFALGQGYDCYYGNNYCHAEIRADSVFMRPSYASKLILKEALTSGVFNSSTMLYCYHGTPPRNLGSILQTGLRPSPGGALGPGLYMSPYPLYAQLYSSKAHGSPTKWKSKRLGGEYFVDILIMLRYPSSLGRKTLGDSWAVSEIPATFGDDYNLHKLFRSSNWRDPSHGNTLAQQVIHCVKDCPSVKMQGIIVKFHDKNPYGDDGEFAKITRLLGD